MIARLVRSIERERRQTEISEDELTNSPAVLYNSLHKVRLIRQELDSTYCKAFACILKYNSEQ